MGCYTIPAATAVIYYFMRKNGKIRNDKENRFLNIMFLGAGMFGVIDHIWNKELFMFNFGDVLLGFVITLSIMIFCRVAFTLEVVKDV